VTTDLRAALAFLTRLRVAPPDPGATGAAAFGLVGAAIGLAGLVPLVVLGSTLPVAAAILALTVVAVASGGLHIDGLADTADALLAPDPAAAERARTDPAIGPGGVAVLFLVLALDVATLSALAGSRDAVVAGLACVVAATGSRAAAVAVAWLERARIPTGGLGGWFVASSTGRAATIALATAVLAAVAVGLAGRSVVLPAASLAGLAAGVVTGAWIVRARGGIDGDALGATVEVTFAAILLAAAVVVTVPAR
jgi:adenosylcobinamide-GDP ribazoletransferase